MTSRSEADVQAELHLAHVGSDRSDRPSARTIVDVVIRRVQIDMIEGVIVFPAELDGLTFRDREYLSQRKIHQEDTRANQ